MAKGPDVLRATVEEAARIARTGGTLAELQSLALLAHTALEAGDGQVPDAEVRKSALPVPSIHALVSGELRTR